MMIPDDLLYTESHEWIKREGDKIRVGITDHAQSELTDVVYVELPKLERQVNAKEPIAVVESVKAASDIYAPVKGSIVEANKALEADPGLINREPYGQGWIFVLKVENPDELKNLKEADAYKQSDRLKAEFFRTPADFRSWLDKNHATATELWVGFYKKGSGKPSITWQESVDQALCFGWIDGIRKRVNETSYQTRFTPRRRGSIWSAINIKRAKELVRQKRMRPAGLKAFEARIENKSGIYSYEQRSTELPEPYANLLKENKEAWKFFQTQPPSYRKMIGWWIVSAKKEETRMARLAKLIGECAKGKRL